jgi:hypothetical protein
LAKTKQKEFSKIKILACFLGPATVSDRMLMPHKIISCKIFAMIFAKINCPSTPHHTRHHRHPAIAQPTSTRPFPSPPGKEEGGVMHDARSMMRDA